MQSNCIVFLFLVASISAEPYRRGGGSHGGSYGGGSQHSYPSSHGYSGTSSGRHTYAQSTGLSGSTHHIQQTSYQHNQQHNTYNYAHKTEVHHHYHYNPPQHISYGSTYHPVYQAPPPVYVYEYRDSGSRFDTLLTGLALYNLGRMSERHHDVHREYRSNPGEVCKLGIHKQNGEYEETRIDCKLMSSFIWESDSQSASANRVNQVSSNTITTVVETKSNNGIGNAGDSTNSKVTTVTVQNTAVVDALQVKGPSIPVTAGMKCFMIRISRDTSVLKKNVDCSLLQMYAQQSLRYNDGARVLPTFILLLISNYFCIF